MPYLGFNLKMTSEFTIDLILSPICVVSNFYVKSCLEASFALNGFGLPWGIK